MGIVFFGFQSWGLATLRAIIESGRSVALVVTHPDAEDQYNRHFTDSVAKYGSSVGIPVLVKRSADLEVVSAINAIKPQCIVSSNWRRVLPPELISAPDRLSLNVHRSLLPKYAGLAPINWAIANGEQRVGVTIHVMEPEVDLGDIVAQEGFDVGPDETATEVFLRTNPVVGRLIVAALDDADHGNMRRVRPDPAKAEFYHARGKRELLIDWSTSRQSIYNLIRAQSDPFANAYTAVEGKIVMVKTARIPQLCYRGTPSRVVQKTPDGGVVVLCGTGGTCQGIEILRVAVGDDSPLPAAEVLRLGQYLGDC